MWDTQEARVTLERPARSQKLVAVAVARGGRMGLAAVVRQQRGLELKRVAVARAAAGLMVGRRDRLTPHQAARVALVERQLAALAEPAEPAARPVPSAVMAPAEVVVAVAAMVRHRAGALVEREALLLQARIKIGMAPMGFRAAAAAALAIPRKRPVVPEVPHHVAVAVAVVAPQPPQA